MKPGRKLRFGMIGGGRGAFIGAVHRIAAQMDGKAELVAGAFSSDPARSRASGSDLYLEADRAYGNYREMIAAEAKRTDRPDFIVIVTPNHEHFAPAKLALESGFHVVCDKPVTFSLSEAQRLASIVARSGKLFVLTHNYTGNAMVREARSLVRAGRLGTIRKVIVEYSQGWLHERLEKTGNKQATWRTDPRKSGAGGCLGDIGTHAENLARFVTGLEIVELAAEVSTVVPGRALDDDANVLLRYTNGAKGILHCSQIAVGEENNLNLRVYGEKASLHWQQEAPNELTLKFADRPAQTLRRGNSYLSEDAKSLARIPSGHPEGYLEAFANIYRDFFRAIAADSDPRARDFVFPTIEDGVAGMQFIATALKSAARGGAWTKWPTARSPRDVAR